MTDAQKGGPRLRVTKTVKLAVVIDGPIHVEEDEKLKFIRHGNKCNISFLDADVETAGVFANS